MATLFDGQEKQIKPGDFFAYATRIGNSGAMNVGLVLEIGDSKVKALTVSNPSSQHDPQVNDRPVWLFTTNMIVVPRSALLAKIADQLEREAVVGHGYSHFGEMQPC